MRCKHCDYRLWGVTGRECPECGTRFLPSEFEFVPNSVRYCCPHCGQDYYGNSPKGHLEPPAFQCVSCGQPVQMDEMTLFPTAGLREEQTQVEQMPWLDRREIGFFRGWLRTVWMGLVSPTRLIGLTPEHSPTGQGFWFLMLTASIASLVSTAPFLAFPAMFGGVPAVALGIAFLVGAIVAMLWPLLVVVIWGGCTHAVLSMTGKREGDVLRTYKAMCYSGGPGVLTAVPCLGVYLTPVAWIWWSISAILMVRATQRVSGIRATAAVLSFPITVAIGLGLLTALWVVPSIGQARSTVMRAQALGMASALRSHALTNGGKGPGHIIELAATGLVTPYEFSDSGDLTTIPVGSGKLQDFAFASPQQQTVMAKAAAAALPSGVVAYRLGDYVFTYPGIDFNTADRRLWIIVFSPQKPRKGIQMVHVGLADGTSTSITLSMFAQALASQNAIRASNGLAALPDPRTVTHNAPALAPVTSSAAAGS